VVTEPVDPSGHAPRGNRPRASELDLAHLAAAKRADPAGQKAFVLTYQLRVLSFCTRMVGATAAEDCAQETLVKALLALPRFDPEGPARLSSWLLTIATRVCIDASRKTKRADATAFEMFDGFASQPSGGESAVLERALRHRIEAAVLKLPDELRATFVLRVTADCSVDDTARILGVDPGTVKSRLARARARLREAIQEV
jgi:RNA polymerase sigma-70 factor (ECF subfamily)